MPSPNGLQSTTTPIREFVTYAEKAYLTLSARRVMHLRRAATARGEEWIDARKLTPLQCSAAVRLSFYSFDEHPRQVLEVEPGSLDAAAVARLAEEILDGPGELLPRTGDDPLHCFVRKA